MKIIEKVSEAQTLARKIREEGERIGFVPTLGFLHEGHLSLIRQARKDCQKVFISIFVNPTQFGPGEDYKKYPRDLERDKVLAEKEGVDFIFAPPVEEMYPKNYYTFVEVEKLSSPLCGRSRPGHFRGVATVVTKLFNIIRPHIAYFGQKDAQQAIIIQRMVRDLNMDVEIKVLPIVREQDGLAYSSRNQYLNEAERRAAPILYRALEEARKMIQSGERNSQKMIQQIEKTIGEEKLARIDYVAVVDSETLKDKKMVEGKTLIALAVWIGQTRLIDNIAVEVK